MENLEVYFSKLPKNCFECPCFQSAEMCCGLDDGTQDYFKDEIDGAKCPLKKIHSHDLLSKKIDSLSKENSHLKAQLHNEKQEIVNEVCEKTCKKCGSKNLYLEPRIKGQDVMTAAMVALKCKDCGTWLKWCPKDERKYYFHNTLKKDKWQKLKEWLKEEQKTFKKISKSLAKADYELLANCMENILLKMQELEEGDG